MTKKKWYKGGRRCWCRSKICDYTSNQDRWIASRNVVASTCSKSCRRFILCIVCDLVKMVDSFEDFEWRFEWFQKFSLFFFFKIFFFSIKLSTDSANWYHITILQNGFVCGGFMECGLFCAIFLLLLSLSLFISIKRLCECVYCFHSKRQTVDDASWVLFSQAFLRQSQFRGSTCIGIQLCRSCSRLSCLV